MSLSEGGRVSGFLGQMLTASLWGSAAAAASVAAPTPSDQEEDEYEPDLPVARRPPGLRLRFCIEFIGQPTRETRKIPPPRDHSLGRYFFVEGERARFTLLGKRASGRAHVSVTSTPLCPHRLLAEYLVSRWLVKKVYSRVLEFVQSMARRPVFVLEEHRRYRLRFRVWGYPSDTRRLDATMSHLIHALQTDSSSIPSVIDRRHRAHVDALEQCIGTVQRDLCVRAEGIRRRSSR